MGLDGSTVRMHYAREIKRLIHSASVTGKVECLNEVAEDVYMIPIVEHDSWLGKRCRLEDESHVGGEEAPNPLPYEGFVRFLE